MDLSNDLISQFAKLTTGDKDKNKENTVYGTVKIYEGKTCVKIDGSDLLTPVDTTTEVKDGERVAILIKNHSAVIMGNTSDPSASVSTTDGITENMTKVSADIGEFKELTTENFEAVNATIKNLNVEELRADVAEIDKAIINKADIADLNATNATITNLQADVAKIDEAVINKADIEDLDATNASILNLQAYVAEIDEAVIRKADIGDLNAVNANVANLQADVAKINDAVIDKADIADLDASNARIDNLQADVAGINTAIINKANVSDLNAANANIAELQAGVAEIDKAIINKAEISDLDAATADIDILNTQVANIGNLVNGNLTSDNIASLNLTSANTTIQNAMIKDAMIDSVTASKLTAGVIDTNVITVKSNDGSMILTGSIQQFKDENGKVRIQIGKDGSGNFTFVLYDETGNGVLIDESGIKSSDAIADGLIVDAKVAENANISGSKLDIKSVITEVNNDNSTTIKSNKIFLDEQGQSLEVAFNSLKTQVETIQDVTIDGDLSSIVEQVQSNTTQIEVSKENINMLMSENTIRTEEIKDLNDEIVKVNNEMSTKYTTLQQDLSGFKTSVGETYTSKTEFNNLEIGGKNLIKNSAPESTSNWTPSKGWVISLVDCASAPYGKAVRSTNETGTSGGMHKAPADRSKLINGECYTISAWIRASKNCRVDFKNEWMVAASSINVTTEWKKYTVTSILDTSLQYNSNAIYAWTSDTVVGMWIEVHSLKLEKGNKATDWTPAPEDVQGDIDAVANNLSANYSTTSQMNSAITQKANEITSSVSQTYATKTEFNNLEIGGRNLVTNSAFIDGSTGWIFGDNATIDTTTTFNGHPTCKTEQSGWTTDKWNGCMNYNIPTSYSGDFKAGEVLTYSCWYYVEDASTFDSKICLEVKGKKPDVTSESSLGGHSVAVADIIQGKWVKMVKTVTLSEDMKDCCIRAWVQRNGTAWFADFKLEKGNRATDWTPAPEDVQGDIDAVANNLSANYSTTSQMNSAITQKANEITSSVSQTYATKTEFNNLEIGGRNLIDNSAPESTSNWTPSNGWVISLVDCASAPYGKAVRSTNESETSGGMHHPMTRSKLVNGEYYTISAWIRASKNCRLRFRNECMETFPDTNVTTEWKKYAVTGIVNTNTQYCSNTFYFYGNATTVGDWIEVHSLKLEKGNKATDWTPAPEDVQGDIDAVANNLAANYSTTSQMNSAITQKANEITSSVSQTYATKTEFNNLEIGGRNLYPNSNFVTTPECAEQTVATQVKYGYSFDSGNVIAKYGGQVLQLYDNQGTSDARKDNYHTIAYAITLDPNTTYTLSFDIQSAGAIVANSSCIYLYETYGDISARKVIGLDIKSNNNKKRERRKVTFTTDSTYLIFQLRFGFINTAAAWLAVEGIKLEKGNKATDWTPAPEDVQGDIDAVANNLAANYSTTSQMNSAINQKANEITSSVSQTYATKTEFNNLEIGGRNLVLNSNFEKPNRLHWTDWGSPTVREIVTLNGKKWCHIASSGTKYQGVQQRSTGVLNVTPGEQYTLSFKAYGTSTNQRIGIGIHWRNSAGEIIAQHWKGWLLSTSANVYSDLFVCPNSIEVDKTITNVNIMVGINENVVYDIYFTDIKFEKGNKATDWSPAPEDIQGDIDTVSNNLSTNYSTTSQMNSAINQKANEITSSISQTYTTKSEFNNLEIGGRNLIANSAPKSTSNWTPSNGWVLSLVDCAAAPYGKAVRSTNESATSGGMHKNLIDDDKIVNGEYYTVSAWIRASENCKIRFRNEHMETYPHTYVTTTWQKYVITGIVNTSTQYHSNVFYFGTNEAAIGMWIEVHSLKLEKGTKATDWTPAPEDAESDITSLTTRMSTAESKLTKNSLTTTIGNYYTTSSDVNGIVTSKGYATTSQVTQTTDALSAKFSSSGGYNLIKNSSGLTGVNTWSYSNSNASLSSIVDDTVRKYTASGKAIRVGNTATSEACVYSSRFLIQPGKTYTVSGKYYVGSGCTGIDVYLCTSNSIPESASAYDTAYQVITDSSYSSGTYKAFSKTITVGSSCMSGYVRLDNNGTSTSGTQIFAYFADLMVTEGSLPVPWSPHPNEIYSGITTIDATGIKVQQTGYNGHTHISAGGFYVNDGSTDVIKITKDGSVFTGKVVVQSGSTVPTSVLSGKVTSTQLDSAVTSDISTAKSNASTALSTANTAKSTADTVTTTVNNGKTNWNNAYNRVNEWAYGAVTGTTTIDGALIETNTIKAKSIILGDTTNLCIVNPYTDNNYGGNNFTIVTVGTTKYFRIGNTSSAGYYQVLLNKGMNAGAFKKGDKYRVAFDGYASASCGVIAILRAHYTDGSYVTMARVETTMSTSYDTKDLELTINNGHKELDTAKTLNDVRLFIETNNHANYVYLTNILVNKKATGELIVDGAINTDKLAANAVTAAKIAADTITSAQIASNAITANEIAANAVTAGKIAANAVTAEKIQAGSITTSKLAVKDGTNYSQLTDQTAASWGWTKEDNSSDPYNCWYRRNTISRDNQISEYYPCKGGESFRVSADIFTSVYGQSTSGGTATATARGVTIMLFTQNTNNTKSYIGTTRVTAASTSGTTQSISGVIALPTNARRFAVYVQIDGYPTFSGTLKVRNIIVSKMASSELIVDGSITADKIAANAITADMITTGTLDASKVTVKNINASNITSGTINANTVTITNINASNITSGTISGDRIKGGTLTATTEIQFQGGARIFGNTGETGAGLTISAGSYNFTGASQSFIGGNLDISGSLEVDSNITGNKVTSNSFVGGSGSFTSIYASNTITTASTLAAASITSSGSLTASNIMLNTGSIWLGTQNATVTASQIKMGTGGYIAAYSGFHFVQSNGNAHTVRAGTIYSNGNVVTSDKRKKVDIRYVGSDVQSIGESGLMSPNTNITTADMHEFISELPLTSFRYTEEVNDNRDFTHYGFLTQDIMYTKVGSELVAMLDERKRIGDDEDYTGYNQEKLIAFIIGALQEEIKARKALEKRLNDKK